MSCDKFIFVSKYLDNELSEGQKEQTALHIKECIYCRNEMEKIRIIRKGISAVTIQSDPDEFWSTLKGKLDLESCVVSLRETLLFGISKWSKRLIPVPIMLALMIAVISSVNFKRTNLVDEYIFGTSFNGVDNVITQESYSVLAGSLIY